MKCIVCDKELTGRKTKFCSIECKTKYYGKYENKSKKSKQSSLKSTKTWIKSLKEQIDELLGTKCIICGRDYKLISHKKDGIDHSTVNKNGKTYSKNGTQLAKDVIANPDKFVRVCWNCHKGVHWCMMYLGWTWKDIQQHLNTSR